MVFETRSNALDPCAPEGCVSNVQRFDPLAPEGCVSNVQRFDPLAPEGCVSNVQRFSLHDGGGIRTVVFLKGCPFRCPWCCNPENLKAEPELSFSPKQCIRCSPFGPNGLCTTDVTRCPTGAKKLIGTMRSVASIVDEVMRDRVFYDESSGGVTLSGGECFVQEAYAMAVLAEVHRQGVNTAVETSLALPLHDPARLAEVCDVFLVDFKLADDKKSRSITGIDVRLRDENLKTLLGHGADVVARMPIIPGYTDDICCVEANIARICELGITRADILPFHQLGEGKYDAIGRDYALRGLAQLSDADVLWVAEAATRAGLRVSIHGE